MTKSKSQFNQWLEINKILKIFKVGFIGMIVLNLISWIFITMLINKPPLVISKDFSKVTAYKGVQKQPDITDTEVKLFIHEFIKHRYNWEQYKPKLILKEVSPLITKGLSNKFKKILPFQYKELKGKSLQQSIVNVKVTIDKENVRAIFDRVLKIDNIPLITTSQIAFNIIKGENTWANPLGLYVNGLIEHHEK